MTEFGIVMEVKLLQYSKARSKMLETELGIITEDNLEQLLNAQPSILVTEFGIVIEVRLELFKYLYITVYQCLPR